MQNSDWFHQWGKKWTPPPPTNSINLRKRNPPLSSYSTCWVRKEIKAPTKGTRYTLALRAHDELPLGVSSRFICDIYSLCGF